MANTIASRNLITMQRKNAAGTLDVLYPKTIASQVFVDATTTVADHITDTAKIHLSAAERTALDAKNNANGFLQLDAQGFVPSANLNPSVLAVNIEFADIAAMLAATTAQVGPGQLVMCLDASADTTVESGWAIYRRLASANDLTQLSAWQKVGEAESLDVVVSWDNIQNKPTSSVTDIDDAVTKKHAHENETVLNNITETDGVLKYGSDAIAFSKDVVVVTVAETASAPDAANMKEGDLFFEVTGTSEF